MLELRIQHGRRRLPIFELPATLGEREAARLIGNAIEALIAFVDDLAGDCDLEFNGDETDGGGAEDEPCAYFRTFGEGPGCSISDPDRDDEEID